MIYNVAGLLREEVGAVRTYTVEDETIIAADGRFQGVAGRIRMTRTDRGILVQAGLTGETVTACARCLGTAPVDLSVQLDEEFFPINADLGVGSSLLRDTGLEDAEVPEFWIDEANGLDLAEPARQAFISEMPIAAFCRPDCRGLCPRCGADRNRQPCHCDTATRDPRWEALSTLGATLKQP